MAAWEFAAGRFSDYRATLFCLPLIALGVVLIPSGTFRAFVLGRHSTSLYGRHLGMELSLATVRKSTLPDCLPEPGVRDGIEFVGLTVISSMPLVLLGAAAMAIL
ncbi:MAG: hypothetical protein O3A84_04920 [Proteobacteria bacterium]|nr:hypothetical protein [Pseudomonadota bacterium]